MAYETMMSLFIEQFLIWTEQTSKHIHKDFWLQLVNCWKSLQTKPPSLMENSVCELVSVMDDKVVPLLKYFKDTKSKESPTFLVWAIFLDACEILLHHIKAERSGDWALHLHATASMLPFLRAANRTHYSRWLPVYLLDMLDLPEVVQEAFNDGQFSVRETGKPFNGIWSDMSVEKTIVKDAKSESGIQQPAESALVRWAVTRQKIGEYARTLKERCGFSVGNMYNLSSHSECDPGALKRDEEDAEKLINQVKTETINPFDVSQHPDGILVQINSGVHASLDIKRSLTNMRENSQEKVDFYVKMPYQQEVSHRRRTFIRH